MSSSTVQLDTPAPLSIKTVAVIGAGQMGGGIAQVLASSGFDTLLYDASSAGLNKGMKAIYARLTRQIEKGTLTAEARTDIISRLKSVTALEELKSADLVIEAIIENEPIKLELFAKLDAECQPSCILATNTSSISITKIAAATKRPTQVVGMHFMNPVPVMKLVELIRGLQTSDETYETAKALTLKLEKTPVTANHDYPGFIVNRILLPMINEAIFALMEGIASPEDIDTAMKLGTNQPMGPLTLADFIGLDTCLAITQILHRELGDDKFRPCPLLVKYVEAGWHGKKSGRGFYKYE